LAAHDRYPADCNTVSTGGEFGRALASPRTGGLDEIAVTAAVQQRSERELERGVGAAGARGHGDRTGPAFADVPANVRPSRPNTASVAAIGERPPRKITISDPSTARRDRSRAPTLYSDSALSSCPIASTVSRFKYCPVRRAVMSCPGRAGETQNARSPD